MSTTAGDQTGGLLSELDRHHLRRCVELATEALNDGDEPFGSVLVDATGQVLFEDRNRVKDGDHTRHPELEIAKWAAVQLSPAQRAASAVYTSGEHCRSEEHTSELQSRGHLVCRLLLEKNT